MYNQLSYNISVQTVKARCRMGQAWMVILMKLRLRLVWFCFLSLILDIATILIRNPPTPRFRRPYSLLRIKHVNTIRGWVKSVLFFGLELCVWLVWAILPRNSYLLMCSVIYIRLGHTVNMPASFHDVGPIHLLPSKFLKGKFAKGVGRHRLCICTKFCKIRFVFEETIW